MNPKNLLPGSVELVRRDPQCTPGTVIYRSANGTNNRRVAPSSGATGWFEAIKRNWAPLALFVALCTIAAYFVSKSLTPMYEATSLVEVDYQQPTGIVGQDALRPPPSNDSDTFLATQVKLVTSDHVVRPVAEEYDLLKLEKQVRGKDPQADHRVRSAPIVLKRLHVGRQVGTQLLSIGYSSPSPELSCNVVNQIAERYVNRVLELRMSNSATLSTFMGGQLQDLKAKMDRSNAMLAKYESDMGIINPEQRTTVLSSRLIELTSAYTKAQNDRMQKQASFDATKKGTNEAAQISALGDILSRIDERRIAARENLASIGANFGKNYPDYRKAEAEVNELDKQYAQTKKSIDSQIGTDYEVAAKQEDMLARQIKEAKAEYDDANKHAFSYQQLKREADDDKVMYDELLRKVRESSINAGFQNQNIKVVETGLPAAKPSSPNVPLNLAVAFFSSALLGAAFVVGRQAFDGKLRDARLTGERLHAQVLGVLPSVPNMDGRLSIEGAASQPARLTGGSSSKMQYALYEESVRKLRNTVNLVTSLEGIRTLMVTSAMPGEGKSTTAGDLALSFAEQKKKTLIIDADLRRPVLHHRFGVPNVVGTADLLLGVVTAQEAIHVSNDSPYLFVMPSGRTMSPANAMESPLENMLADLRQDFDLIVIDAPPVLPFAETMLIAASVESVVFVARSGITTADAAENALSILQGTGVKVLGIVMNDVPKEEKTVSYQSQGYSYHEGRR